MHSEINLKNNESFGGLMMIMMMMSMMNTVSKKNGYEKDGIDEDVSDASGLDTAYSACTTPKSVARWNLEGSKQQFKMLLC